MLSAGTVLAAAGHDPMPPAIDQVVASCDNPETAAGEVQQASLDGLFGTQPEELSLELVLTRQGYDIVTVTRDGARWSLASTGLPAELVMQNGTNIHMVIRRETGIEHFLFMLGIDGSGTLLWSSAASSARSTCFSPF